MLHALKNLPEYLLFPAIIGPVFLIIFLSMIIPRRLMLSAEETNSEGFDSFLAVSAAIATMLIFSLTSVDATYNASSDNVSLEAEAIYSFDKNLELYGTAHANDLRAILVHYADQIVKDEWKDIQTGNGNKAVDDTYEELVMAVKTFEPASAKQEIIYRELVMLLHEIDQLRSKRISAGEASLPSHFWTILILLFSALPAIALHLKASSERLLTTSVIGFVLGILTSAILIIDGPFIGSHAISPEPIVHIIDVMRKEVPITMLVQ
ncbi:MAG: DUF4239 domain-containing protein [Alphaproteobacteria bacterium]